MRTDEEAVKRSVKQLRFPLRGFPEVAFLPIQLPPPGSAVRAVREVPRPSHLRRGDAQEQLAVGPAPSNRSPETEEC